jgi:hypothetical protein
MVSPDLGHSLIVTRHAVYTLAGLGENQLVYSVATYFAFKTMCMVGVVAGHNGLVEDGLMTYIATVRALCAYRGAVR